MNHRSDQLLGVIGAVRKRRNLLIVLRGAITVAATAAMLVITGLAAYRFRFSAAALVSSRFAALSVIAAVYFALVRPLRRARRRSPAWPKRNIQALKTVSSARSSFQAKMRAAFSPVIMTAWLKTPTAARSTSASRRSFRASASGNSEGPPPRAWRCSSPR